MIVQPPPVTVDPPPISVTPPPFDVTPPPISVTPPPIRVGGVAVNVPPLTVQPPPIRVAPATVTVDPPAVTVKPPKLTVTPPPLTIDPPRTALPATPIEIGLPLVATGELPESLARFDRAMRSYMRKHLITAGSLAVMKGGRLVLSRGYGWRDPSRNEALSPQTPMRFASIAKPITLAAIRKLIGAGRLAPMQKAFALLDVAPLNRPGHKMDARLPDITIQHLIDHAGGWDWNQAPLFDPMFQTPLISEAVGRVPASADDVVRFMVGQPLQFKPGSRSIYSNFGYCVLGRIIEKAAGKPYIEFIRNDLLDPIGITGIRQARSLAADRPSEPPYITLEMGPNVVNPAIPPGPLCNGGFHIEAMDSHGGLIGSAADLVRFAAQFNIAGELNGPTPEHVRFDGSLPGTSAFLQWRNDNIQIAGIFNLRHAKNCNEIAKAMMAAADSVTNWP